MRVIFSSTLLLAPFVYDGFVYAGILHHPQENALGREAQLDSLLFSVVHSTSIWPWFPPSVCVSNSEEPLPTVSNLVSN